MSPSPVSIAVLSLLVPVALAVPRFPHLPRVLPTAYPSGGPLATGGPTAPYGQFNSTVARPTGTGSASVIVSVVTLVPLPVSSSASQAPSASSAHGVGKPSSSDSVTEHSGSEEVDSCGPATVTVTAENTVTVTVGASSVEVATSVSELPARIASPNLVESSTAPSGKGYSNPPARRSSTEPHPTPASSSKHGHNHLKFHRKSTSSVAPSSSAPDSATQAPAERSPTSAKTPVPEKTSTPEQAPAPESTSTPVLVVPSQSITPSPTPESDGGAPPTKETPPPFTAAKESPLSSTAEKPKASSSSTPSSVGTKRGLVYNTAALTQRFESAPISWAYNWDSQPGGDIPANFNFVPMMWGPLPVHTGRWKSNADAAIASGSTHLLGFNEPDLPAQANLSPQQAAEAWRTYMEPYAGKAKLGSPAVCNGEDKVGLSWLSRFFEACGGCTVDFVAIHWYGLASDAGVEHFKAHVAKAVEVAAGRPLWITEFQPHGSPEEQAGFLKKVLPWLDESSVERYAYFQVDAILASADGLTDLGAQYAA